MKPTGKRYDSVLDMVKDTMSDDPEFVAEFERTVKRKEAVAALVETLSPSERLYIFMPYCPYCGEKRPGSWLGKPCCPVCAVGYEMQQMEER
jgi:hypothetical protein